MFQKLVVLGTMFFRCLVRVCHSSSDSAFGNSFSQVSYRITVWWLLLKGLMRHKMVMRSIQELTVYIIIYIIIYINIYIFVYLFIFIFICLFRYSLVRGQNPTINQQIFGICFPMFSADSQHVGTTRRRRNQKYQGAHL